jgi:formylglycine-generating enzyme required for sulfatase activity
LCPHRYLNREVIITSLFHADLEQGLDKVFAEAQTLLLLSREHPSIIGVQDCNFADDAQARPYIVMDYFPGVSLQAHLEQLGPKAVLPLEDFLPIARQIAEAMRAAHGKDVLHRDLKPDNVLVLKVDGRWQVKVIDFGLAVRSRTSQVSTDRPTRERTMYGDSAAGTAEYASLEQMGKMPGIKPGTYSDVYTFGKLCCYALFRDTEPKRRQWASLPPELADMLERCVEKDLEHRHRNVEPVLGNLEALDPVLGNLEALDPVEANRRAQEEEARRQAEAERQCQEQARQTEVRRRQDEERQKAEEKQRREREEAEPRREEQELARLRQEGETKLALLVRDAYDRTRGKPTEDDNRAAAELFRRHQLSQDRAKAIACEVREQWQKEQPREPQPGDVVTNTLGMKFAWVPPGTFRMGSDHGDKDEKPVHRVTLTRGFYMGVHPVTQAQWEVVMGSNPSHFQGADCPVETVAWDDCQDFCARVAKLMGKPARLPTEVEWEYACRAGTTTDNYSRCAVALHPGLPSATRSAGFRGDDGRLAWAAVIPGLRCTAARLRSTRGYHPPPASRAKTTRIYWRSPVRAISFQPVAPQSSGTLSPRWGIAVSAKPSGRSARASTSDRSGSP